MFRSVLELGDTLTREVMVPRTDMVTAPEDTPLRKALALLLRSGFSRVPLVGDSVDDLRGVLYLKDVVGRLPIAPAGGRTASEQEAMLDAPASSLARPAVFVPESKPVDELLRELQERLVAHGDGGRRVRRHRRARDHRGRARGDRRRADRRARPHRTRGRGAGRRRLPGPRPARPRRAGRAVRPRGGRRGRRQRRRPAGQGARQGSAARAPPATSTGCTSSPTASRAGAAGSPRCWSAWPRARTDRRTPPPRAAPRPTPTEPPDDLPLRVRLLRRAPQRRQVDADQRARRPEGRDHVRPPADHPAHHPRHRAPARRPADPRRHPGAAPAAHAARASGSTPWSRTRSPRSTSSGSACPRTSGSAPATGSSPSR